MIFHDGTSVFYRNIRSYFLLTIVFIVVSFLSIVTINKVVSGGSSFDISSFLSFQIILIIIIFLLIYYLLDGLRVFFIAKSLHVEISFKLLFNLVFINIFVSNITPFASGGGVAQIYYLNKNGVSIGNATAITTLRTVLAIAFFFITIPVVFFFEDKTDNIPHYLGLITYSLMLTFFYFFILLIIIFKNKWLKMVIYKLLFILRHKRLITRRRFKKVSYFLFKEVTIFVHSMIYFFKGNVYDMLLSVLFTALYLITLFSFSIILFNSLGYNLSFTTIVSFNILITFIMYFAPTPGASGIAEGAYSYMFSNLVDKSDIVSLTFAWRFITTYIGMLIGLAIFYIQAFKKENIFDDDK